MKITEITTYIVGNAWKNWVFVRVDTDEGLHGIGEATLNGFAKTVEAAIHELKHLVIGQDPFDVENHSLRLFRDVFSDGGQIQGAYANGWYRGPREPQSFHDKAKEVVSRGYTALKFDPFGAAWRVVDRADFALAIDIIAAVRDAVGPNVDILIEGHNRFSVHTALQFADAMAPYNPTWFEAPVPPQRISAMVEVAKRSPVPVACGEDYYCAQQFSDLLGHDAVHIIQLEPQYLGLTASKQICGMVNAHNGVTAPHSAQGPLCSLVCAHLNTATPNFFIHEIFDEFNEDWSEIILTNPITVNNGYIELEEDRVGWGTDLNYDEIAQHPYNPNNFLPLFRSGWERRKPVDQL